MKLKDGENVTLEIAGADVSLSAAVLTEMFIERLRGQPGELLTLEAFRTPEEPPPIGSAWQGGIYAGVARGEDGQPDHHLIVLTQAEAELKWKAANEWAEKAGGALPTRRELALCYANVPEIFDKAWYWSSTQSAGGEASAWYRGFNYGDQNDNHKDGELRARAVRRLTI
jgi:hypothetical protein